jgi:hypothetical protein
MASKWFRNSKRLLHATMKHNQSIGSKALHDLKSRSVGRFCGNNLKFGEGAKKFYRSKIASANAIGSFQSVSCVSGPLALDGPFKRAE